jgi:hypothetical protein
MWPRLSTLAALDADATMQMVDRIIRSELNGEYPHFNVSELGPVLEVGLQFDVIATQQKAKDIVNLLGDHGFTEFGTLL